MILGIDIGGANIKIASFDPYFAKTIYAPLWKNKTVLYDVLSDVKKEVKGIEAMGVVMTGELCDCFRTKREGVLYIGNTIHRVFKEKTSFFDVECTFKDYSSVKGNPISFSSTNWLASTKLISKKYRNTIFIDIGSTTTDIIPIVGGEIKAKKTDLERLKNGELLYSGILRTNASFLLKKVKIGDEECRTSSELFAITADAYLILGYIKKEDYSCGSPNSYTFGKKGKREEKSKISAMRRLARLVCSDLEEIEEDGAMNIAEQIKNAQLLELRASIEAFKNRHGLSMTVAAGIGEFLVKEAADLLDLNFIPLSSIYSNVISNAFPAFAVAKLLEEGRVA